MRDDKARYDHPMNATGSQVLVGRFAGKTKREFYREKEGVLLVETDAGTMWLPLVTTGATKHKFDPEREMVLVFLMDRHTPTSTISDEGSVSYTPYAFALVVSVPPQLLESITPRRDEANVPTKILGGSDSSDDDRVTVGVSETAKVVATDDMVLIKSQGGQMAFCRDGIVKRGNLVDMSFFSDSKAGVLKQNWIGHIIPQSVVTPFPSYTIDTNIVKRIAGLGEAISSLRG